MRHLPWLKGIFAYLKADRKTSAEKQAGLVSAMLVVSVAIYIFFALLNYAEGFYSLAFLLAALAVVNLVTLFLPNKQLSVAGKEWITLSGLIVLLLALYALGGIENTGIYWLSMLPFIVFSICGIKQGRLYLLAFLIGLFTLQILDLTHVFHVAYTLDQTLIFLASFAVYTVLAFIFEVLRIQGINELESNNQKLESMQGKLNDILNHLEKEIEKRTFQLRDSNDRLKLEVEHHKATNQMLTETEHKFYQAQKMESLGTLVSGMAYDFSNILSGITANIFLIQREIKGNDLVQHKLDDVERLVMQATDMTGELLTFSCKDQADKKHFDINIFMHEAVKLAVMMLPSRIKFEQVFTAEKLPIFGDTSLLQQVLMNLLSNARDALARTESPFIKISMARLSDMQILKSKQLEGEWLHLSISDNGEGINPEQLTHVFEPFFTTKTAGKGTGLGLAMCYGAIQSHGGMIEAESIVDEGTTFHIYLPLEQKSEIEQGNKISIDDNLTGKGETLLLVDHDENLRAVHQSVLEKLNYRVLQASDGLEAVKIYADNEKGIDLVMIDTMIPNIGGAKTAEHMMSLNQKTKILFTTVDEDDTAERWMMRDAESLRGVKCLTKPFSVETLCQVIRTELDKNILGPITF